MSSETAFKIAYNRSWTEYWARERETEPGRFVHPSPGIGEQPVLSESWSKMVDTAQCSLPSCLCHRVASQVTASARGRVKTECCPFFIAIPEDLALSSHLFYFVGWVCISTYSGSSVLPLLVLTDWLHCFRNLKVVYKKKAKTIKLSMRKINNNSRLSKS